MPNQDLIYEKATLSKISQHPGLADFINKYIAYVYIDSNVSKLLSITSLPQDGEDADLVKKAFEAQMKAVGGKPFEVKIDLKSFPIPVRKAGDSTLSQPANAVLTFKSKTAEHEFTDTIYVSNDSGTWKYVTRRLQVKKKAVLELNIPK